MITNEALLSSEKPWIRYRVLLDLFSRQANDPEVIASRSVMLADPLVQSVISDVQKWPGGVINSHKSASALYHKLAFLADLGITAEDFDSSAIISDMGKYQSNEGLYTLPMNIPVHFGGTGKDSRTWVLCDAPMLLFSAGKMKLRPEEEIHKSIHYLNSLIRENGWPCASSADLGKFRGPGRKDDPCPYVNLIMLKLLALFDEYKNSNEAKIGVECLLHAWETSLTRHPYMFYMGTDFRKLKAPFIWYDILHVVSVLSEFDFARKDARFREMLEAIHSKADLNGMYSPESIWQAWKGWEFSNKKAPSEWITLQVRKISARAGL
jgi:hypothetical protein